MSLSPWYQFMLEVRRLAQSHALGGAGIVARAQMQEAVVQASNIEPMDTPDPVLFHALRRLSGDWSGRGDDAWREALSPVIFTMCEALRSENPEGS